MELNVEVTQQAFDEIDEIFSYIKQRSPENAVRWRELLLSTAWLPKFTRSPGTLCFTAWLPKLRRSVSMFDKSCLATTVFSTP